ncbi:MAG: preprotein translocase subunit SecG [Planctomycetaceae bacterium]
MSYFLLTLLLLVGLFLIIVILLQRGRGGGLAGAFGGLGGQSAFGARAGDTFTWITVLTVLIWVLLAGLTGRSMYSDSQVFAGRETDDIDVGPDTSTGTKDKANPSSGTQSEFEDFPVPPKKEAGTAEPESDTTEKSTPEAAPDQSAGTESQGSESEPK